MNQDQPLDNDPVNHPSHYTSHPSGVECIQVTEHMSFNVGNAIKYLWRAGMKGAQLQDLEKARWYIDRELLRLTPKEEKSVGCDPSRPEPPFTSMVGKSRADGTKLVPSVGRPLMCKRCGEVFLGPTLPTHCSCGAAL